MYKNYKKCDTHPFTRINTHTYTHSITTGISEDLWSLLRSTALLCIVSAGFRQSSGLKTFPVRLRPGSNRKRSHTLKQAVHSHSLYTTSAFASLRSKAGLNFFTAVSHGHQSIPPMSCCLYDCETREPDGEHRRVRQRQL